MSRGRRSEAELTALRARIETLLLSGLRAAEIHRALTGPESPNPISLSERQVRAHIVAVERGWAERAGRTTLEADRGRAIAQAAETVRVAPSRSALNARSNIGVGFLNASIRAQDQLARLRGLYAPTQTELSGPAGAPLGVTVTLADHPAEHLDPAEEARRFRQLATDIEAEASREAADRLSAAFGLTLGDVERLTINAMKSAFVGYDERVRIIYDRIKPGYAKLRGEPALVGYPLPPSA